MTAGSPDGASQKSTSGGSPFSSPWFIAAAVFLVVVLALGAWVVGGRVVTAAAPVAAHRPHRLRPRRRRRALRGLVRRLLARILRRRRAAWPRGTSRFLFRRLLGVSTRLRRGSTFLSLMAWGRI